MLDDNVGFITRFLYLTEPYRIYLIFYHCMNIYITSYENINI